MTTGSARLTAHAPTTPYHRMELDRVVKIANSRVAVLPGVKAFEVAPMKGDAHHRELQTQIRVSPAMESHPVEFRYNLPLRHSGCVNFDELAWDLVGRAHQFLADSQLANLGATARAAIEPVIAAADGGSIHPRLVAVGISFEYAKRTPRICADIEMLGDDLALGTERVFGFDVDHLEREVARFIENHAKRDAARIRAEGLRASGWIDQTALRLIDAAGLGRRDTIALVAQEGWVDLSYGDSGGDRFDATLQQADGVVTGSAMPRSRRWSLKHGDLIVWAKGMPDTLRDSLTGRLVGDVFQNPALPPNAVIGNVDEVTSVDPDSDEDDLIDGRLRLTLNVPVAEIDEATGEPRAAWLPSHDEADHR